MRAVAELFNRLERTVSAPVLEAIEAQRPELAVSIRNLMFVFDDLVQRGRHRHPRDRSARRQEGAHLALKGASEEIRAALLRRTCRSARRTCSREEMEVLGAVRLRDVEKAQQDIVAIARKLEEEGVIVTGAAAGEAYVI